jgi:putative oxidoreductase
MATLAILLNRLLGILSFFGWIPPLLARLTLASVFIESGWGKLHHIDKVVGFFTDLGLPAPAFQAHLVATTEFAGGILVLAGLCTRFASVPLMIIMLVALGTAGKADIHSFSDLTGKTEFLYLLLLFWLAVTGPGLLAIDALLAPKIKKLG